MTASSSSAERSIPETQNNKQDLPDFVQAGLACFCRSVQASMVPSRSVQPSPPRGPPSVRDKVVVPELHVGEPVLQPGGAGRKDEVEQRDKRHGARHACGGAERIAPVQREVPEHGEHQCDKIAQPCGQVNDVVAQGERADLDEPGRGGEQSELQRTQQLCAAVHRAHAASSASEVRSRSMSELSASRGSRPS